MNQPMFFEIQADDVHRARAFYQDVFGWTFTEQPAPVTYLRITTAGISGGLLARPSAPPPEASGTNAFTVSMEVASFDATAAVILTSGGRVAMTKFAVPGLCWQGYFLDTEGNVFGIFEPDPDAR